MVETKSSVFSSSKASCELWWKMERRHCNTFAEDITGLAECVARDNEWQFVQVLRQCQLVNKPGLTKGKRTDSSFFS